MQRARYVRTLTICGISKKDENSEEKRYYEKEFGCDAGFISSIGCCRRNNGGVT